MSNETLMSTAEVKLNRTALGLAVFTVAYNLAEGALSVWSGRDASLSTMIGFGTDSFIESLVAILVALRINGRLRVHAEYNGQQQSGLVPDNIQKQEHREFLTLRAVAISFIILAGYLIYEGITGIIWQEKPETSVLGFGILIASAIVMPILWWAKVRVGKQLDDSLILADAAETKICLLMTGSSLIGLVLLALTGWGGFDALASFAIAVIALMEAKEAWEGDLDEECCGNCHCD